MAAKFIIRKIVTFHFWKERRSRSSVTEARDMRTL